MEPETTNHNDQLLPERHGEQELFVCDVADAILKDVMAQMEHPFYSLSKKPDRDVRTYEHNGNWLKVTPSTKGQATIYDKDILIYCISQIMAKLARNEPVNRRVRINSRDLLVFTNRGTSGRDYMALADALERLRGTTITTNIRVSEDEDETTIFGLIEGGNIRRKHGLDGRLLWCEVTLSDWVFDSIRNRSVLTLHRDYFRLRKPLERRVYELARKHCGQQPSWRISLALLLKKSGSQSQLKKFRQMIKNLAKHDHLPDYQVRYQNHDDMVVFINRNTMPMASADPPQQELSVYLRTETYDAARQAAPGWDIYHLENEWRAWMTETPRNPDLAFIGFCRKWYETRGAS